MKLEVGLQTWDELRDEVIAGIVSQQPAHGLVKAIEMKPARVSVQRITAGIDDDSLIAPAWCRDRNAQVRHINAALKKVGLKY